MSIVQPYDFAEARTAIRQAAENQRGAEDRLRDAWREWGAKERAYRQALAEEILRLKSNGVAWSSTADLARGAAHVSDLRYERDVAEGVREAAAQASFRHTADRRELEQLVNWSMKVAPDGQYEQRDLRAA